MGDDVEQSRRRVWSEGPDVGREPEDWMALNDDDLLSKVEQLAAEHDHDLELMIIVRSERHFFVRQEAAKKIRNAHLLKGHSGDRHIGQILVRGMTRHEDAEYLERLILETRHLEVRKAAEAQLQELHRRMAEIG